MSSQTQGTVNDVLQIISTKRTSWNKGKVWSEETRAKMRAAKLGKKLTPEHKAKLSHPSWNKGKKGVMPPAWNKGLSVYLGGKKFEKGIVPWNKGKTGVYSEETLELMREANRAKALGGAKHPNWQGGLTNKSIVLRHSWKYKAWRKAVFERDNYTCVLCGGESHGNIQADHIKPFAFFPKDRFKVANGRTLCIECHKTTDTYLWKIAHKRKEYESGDTDTGYGS